MGIILEDVKHVEISPNASVFECLVKIAEIALELFNKEKSMEHNPEKKKKKKKKKKTQPIVLDEPGPSAQRDELVRERSIIREEIKREKWAMMEELFKNPNSNNASALDLSKGERMMKEKSLKKPVVYAAENLSKEDRLKREKLLKRPVIEEKTNKKCRKPQSESDEEFEEGKRVRVSKKKKMSYGKVLDNGPVPPPDLPREFKNKIKECNGYELKLLVQKRVTNSDVNISQNRFTMPVKQVKEDFLRDEEKRHLDGSRCGEGVPEIKVKIIQPNCTQCDVTFKRWDMRKERGKTSSSYVFNGEWKYVRKNNGVESGMVVQVWSFRKPNDELCFAMVIVEKAPKNGDKSTMDSAK